MLKYCWIIILAVIWIVWLIATALDIYQQYKQVGFSFDLWDELEDSSQFFIIVTLVILFIVSFASWLCSLG